MAVPVIMPRQGQSVETCIITQWLKKKGDPVKTGDILFSYETDKASFDAEAETDGVLLEVFFIEGDDVPVLTNVGVIGSPGEEIAGFRPGINGIKPQGAPSPKQLWSIGDKPSTLFSGASPGDLNHAFSSAEAEREGGLKKSDAMPENKVSMNPVMQEVPEPQDQRLRISPRAKTMAVKMGINTSLIHGSGPNGRIIVRDIENIEKDNKDLSVANTQGTPGQGAGITENDEFEEKKLSNIRKLIAKSMYESLRNSAQLTHHLSADVRKLLALRNKIKSGLNEAGAINITLNDMICFAVIKSLKKHPGINSHFTGESIKTFKKVHLGIAVDTPRGLMVPAVKDTGELSLRQLSFRLKEVTDQCRKGNINPDLLTGSASSFTVSNLGNYGVEIFTPIINLPQIAILGVNTIIQRPADLGNGAFGFIPVIGLSLTYDHRAIDGGPATLFLQEIKNQIENFEEDI